MGSLKDDTDCNGRVLALYLGGVDSDFLPLAPGTTPKFIEYADGTALLAYRVVDANNSANGWEVTMLLSGKSATTTRGIYDPVICPSVTVGPDVYFYTTYDLTIVGTGGNLGKTITATAFPHDLHVGKGGSGNNNNQGIGFWFDNGVLTNPDGTTSPVERGDISANLGNITKCTDVCVKPDAGADQTIACVDNKLPTSLQLKTAKARQKYKILGSVPAGANISVASPSGAVTGTIVAGTYNFILQTQSDSIACRDTVRVVVRTCQTGQKYDLALKKSISKKLAMIGDDISYTIKVWNEGQGDATGVEVTDPLNAGVQYVTHATAAGTYNPATKVWMIGDLVVGDTVTLTIGVKVLAQGVWFNTAEITKMNEKDEDSTPGNGQEGEDDIDRQCFTVPMMLCKGQGSGVELTVPDQYKGVVWFRQKQGGTKEQVATGNKYTATETELGSYEYTFTSTSGTCPAEGCCPIIIVVEECCPVQVCVPYTVKRVKIK